MIPKNLKRLRLRKLRESDSARILLWRNDSVTRRHSFSIKKISQAEHHAWFAKALKSKKQILLLANRSNHPVGILRYDLLSPRCAEVNINLNPKERGKGWGGCSLLKGSEWLARYTKIRKIVARIKPQNEASKRAFQNAGFRLQRREPQYEIYECKL